MPSLIQIFSQFRNDFGVFLEDLSDLFFLFFISGRFWA